MPNDLTVLWKQVLTDIELEVSAANFFTLFTHTHLLELDDTTATIAAPSAMIILLLEKRFSHIIKTSLLKHTKKQLLLIFIPKSIIEEKSPLKEIGPLFAQEKKVIHSPLTRVRSDYNFETLAVSQSNELAYVSAQNVAKNPGKTYNPLFIYGPVGVGKTHLMQAVANEMYQKNPSKKIIYITSEEFTNEVVEAIRSNDTAKMKKKFRSADLLIIDDVQFIAGKDRVQEELFHTFNILIDNGAQIVLSSDRPPSEIKKLEARLSSRFSGGLTVDVEAPDFELRTAILLKKAERYGVTLPIDAAKKIAEKQQDVRSLEGALLRVITRATTKNQALTALLAEEALESSQKEAQGPMHADDVIKFACEYYRIKPTQIKGPKRDASLVKPRQIAMYLLKKELGLSFVEIGNMLGGRDHTTVMHGVEKIENLVSSNPHVREEIVGITKTIRG